MVTQTQTKQSTRPPRRAVSVPDTSEQANSNVIEVSGDMKLKINGNTVDVNEIISAMGLGETDEKPRRKLPMPIRKYKYVLAAHTALTDYCEDIMEAIQKVEYNKGWRESADMDVVNSIMRETSDVVTFCNGSPVVSAIHKTMSHMISQMNQYVRHYQHQYEKSAYYIAPDKAS